MVIVRFVDIGRIDDHHCLNYFLHKWSIIDNNVDRVLVNDIK